jgi:hypothetical protein
MRLALLTSTKPRACAAVPTMWVAVAKCAFVVCCAVVVCGADIDQEVES